MFSALFIALLLPTTHATNQLQTAQAHLVQEEWEDAATILDALATTDNPTAEVMYDRGIAHYNLDQFGVAAEAFENAMTTSEDQTLRTHSAFNFGNAVFRKTMQELEGTGTATSSDESISAIDKAKEQIKQALQNYRRAISEDGSDMDARANGEFAWQMLSQLDQMQEQMEEQQEQQQEQKDQEQSQDEKSADEQEKDQQNKEEGDSEQEQQGEGDESKQEKQQEQDSEQSEQQQDGEQSDQQEDGKQGEPSDQDKQQQDQNSEQSEQQQDGEQGKQSEQNDGEQSDQSEQQKPSDQDGEQSEQEETQQDISKGELESEQEPAIQTDVPQASQKEAGKRLSKEEAARLLQRIRDKEQQRRKALAAKRAQRRVPVDKDW